jgi:flavin-dependent dehydrogenase
VTVPVVVGGGLAGAAIACALARAGRDVRLLERETAATDKICGEFLSGEAQLYLHRLGFDLAALGGHSVSRLRLVRGPSVVEATLPFRGLGVSRRVLDEALLIHAARCGVDVMRGLAVSSLRAKDDAVALQLTGHDTIDASTLFLCTGKHDVRGARRVLSHPPEELVGFKTYFVLSADQRRALNGCVEVMMFSDGYAGLQHVEGGRTNLCLLIDKSRMQRVGGNWEGLLEDLRQDSPHLCARLRGAVPALSRPLSIFRVPYGFLHRPAPDGSTLARQGIFRLGDQMGVVPSFAGDGMAIALHSAAVATEVYLSGGGADLYHRRMRRDIAGQIRRAGALYRVGRSGPGQEILMRLAALWPYGLRLAAAMTRVPDSALRRVGI